MAPKSFNKRPYRRRDAIFDEIEKLRSEVHRPPLDGIERYVESTMADFSDLGSYLFWGLQMGYRRIDFARKKTISIENTTKFRAIAEFSTTEKKVEIVVSKGLLHSLDDLFLRLSCNRDFFSIDRVSDKHWWDGCQCLWTHSGSIAEPKTRFYDYELSQKETMIPGRESWLNGFVAALPFDTERRQLADMMFQIAFCWIIAHEEAHHLRGHFDFNNGVDPQPDALRLEFDENAEYSADEYYPGRNLSKLLEFQADRDATKAVMRMLGETSEESLPSYCEPNRKIWGIRLFLTAIGAVLIAMQKARINTEVQHPDRKSVIDSHPAPRTRILSVVTAAMEFLEESQLDASQIIQMFLPALAGSFEDLNTTSEILCKEGNIENLLKSWRPRNAPEWYKNGGTGILDAEEDTFCSAMAVLCSFLPEKAEWPDWDGPQDLREIASDWFLELESEILPHLSWLEDGLRPFQGMVYTENPEYNPLLNR